MREVITRRLDEYLAHKGEEGFGTLPDLILLDGGQQHVAAVRPIIDSYGLDIPVFGMVKDQKHRTRAISQLGEEVAISKNRRVFTLIGNIQEEVHRFAITFHRKTRGKSVTGSTLTKIEGIGETRAKALLKHFRTIAAIKDASEEELAAVEGMTKKAAKAVYDAYRQ
ncbi:MAG: excinuclease ABC subunit UvrC, partial [Firmicutes bacterium]|nr:excinuclease ABC subunit UvrC [Bacillota bacterium]